MLILHLLFPEIYPTMYNLSKFRDILTWRMTDIVYQFDNICKSFHLIQILDVNICIIDYFQFTYLIK